jgi:SWI/SNF-related matrix-associated actin-dependent regulator of chromatin subfamily A member 2/4
MYPHTAPAALPQEWLQTEKRVVVIHRLHQILEPFMLRRQVQDVESRLPEKV